ncbi:MAG: DUF294 nucleotidyltransferase-like domain-containing protein [Pseudomonadota bacterium]
MLSLDDFLQQHPYSLLSSKDARSLSERLTEKLISAGTIFAVQGRTRLEGVYLIRNGSLELFYDKKEEKQLSGILGPGDIFGGISILMNQGISVRTAKAQTDCAFFFLPTDAFTDLCTRYVKFREYFVETFSRRMLNESYASILALNQITTFLSVLEPFSLLKPEELEAVVANTQMVTYPAETVLFIQDRSRVENLHVVYKGAAERYYEEDGRKTLLALAGEGDLFGGISMLVNNGVAVRTLRTVEETTFYLVAGQTFRAVCQSNATFSEFFTDTFGKRMLDRSYAAIIAQSHRPRDTGLPLLNQQISSIYTTNILKCPHHESIQDAAVKMSRHRCSSIFVTTDDGAIAGIVTDNDLRKKVIAAGTDISLPVAHVMSSPVASMPAAATVFEAMMTMMQSGIKHLAVTGEGDHVVGMLTNHDLLMAQGQSPLFLLREIHLAGTPEVLFDKHQQLPAIIKGLINAGAKANNVTRLITTISDAILDRIVQFAVIAEGPPPTDFVFMILGSEGRKEQTLKTDQDNAIIFKDVAPEALEAVTGYFLRLGERICTWLDSAGYAFCQGGIMAKNPKWCQPLSAWKKQFTMWIRSAEAEDLLHASIFFDFRGAYGDVGLIDALRKHLFVTTSGWSGFFRHLTENALCFKPPLGFFRNFVVESKGEHRDAFDIKGAMMPVIDFARIYAIHHGVSETNTLERLHRLYLMEVLTWEEYHELEQAYGFLMQQRFVRQINAITDEHVAPNNYVNPKKLSRIEQTLLKEIFKRIEKYQVKLSFDFIGIP